jgi:hypothetical protein
VKRGGEREEKGLEKAERIFEGKRDRGSRKKRKRKNPLSFSYIRPPLLI